MAEKPAKKRPAGKAGFVNKLVADPAAPPATHLLQGYLGDSSEEGHTRLYFDPELRDYVEIPDGAILHAEEPGAGAGPLAVSLVWIDRNAELVHGTAGTERPRARFLEGRIQQAHLRGLEASGGGQMTHKGDSQCCTPPPPNGWCGPGYETSPERDTQCCKTHHHGACHGGYGGYGGGYDTTPQGTTQCCTAVCPPVSATTCYAGCVGEPKTSSRGNTQCCPPTQPGPCYGGYVAGTSWVGTQCCTGQPLGYATADQGTQCCHPSQGGHCYGALRATTTDVATQCCTNPPPVFGPTALCLPTAWPICWR